MSLADKETWMTTKADTKEVCALLRSCFGVSSRKALLLIAAHSGNLNDMLDALGESDDSPAITQGEMIRRHQSGLV